MGGEGMCRFRSKLGFAIPRQRATASNRQCAAAARRVSLGVLQGALEVLRQQEASAARGGRRRRNPGVVIAARLEIGWMLSMALLLVSVRGGRWCTGCLLGSRAEAPGAPPLCTRLSP